MRLTPAARAQATPRPHAIRPRTSPAARPGTPTSVTSGRGPGASRVLEPRRAHPRARGHPAPVRPVALGHGLQRRLGPALALGLHAGRLQARDPRLVLPRAPGPLQPALPGRGARGSAPRHHGAVPRERGPQAPAPLPGARLRHAGALARRARGARARLPRALLALGPQRRLVAARGGRRHAAAEPERLHGELLRGHRPGARRGGPGGRAAHPVLHRRLGRQRRGGGAPARRRPPPARAHGPPVPRARCPLARALRELRLVLPRGEPLHELGRGAGRRGRPDRGRGDGHDARGALPGRRLGRGPAPRRRRGPATLRRRLRLDPPARAGRRPDGGLGRPRGPEPASARASTARWAVSTCACASLA